MTDQPSWEATLLCRRDGARRPLVAARIALQAPDLTAARHLAAEALDARRASDKGTWSLGILRPLTDAAPGTQRYRITFAIWESDDDRFTRRDVHAIELWAADAQSARRQAQVDVHHVEGHAPSWRIRQVLRIAVGPPDRYVSRSVRRPAVLPTARAQTR